MYRDELERIVYKKGMHPLWMVYSVYTILYSLRLATVLHLVESVC